jgi:Tfp pilus assembly protein PilV
MTSATVDRIDVRQQGFTLIAALTALLIMSIGMVALFRLYIDIRQSSQHTALSATALGLGRDKLEQLRFNSDSEPNGADIHTLNATTFERHWQSKDNPLLHIRHIDVTLHWTDSSGDYSQALTTTVDVNAISSWPVTSP